MAAVEWRGRFRKAPTQATTRERGVDLDVSKTIAAIGKLRGAALVMVVGAVLMLGSAWVAKESANAPTPATTTNQQGANPTQPPPPPPPPPSGSGGGG
jgi:hypothetical protein